MGRVSINNKGGLILDLKLGVVLFILITSVMLTACTDSASRNNKSDTETLLEETGSLSICSGDEVLGEVTLAQIKELESYKRSMVIHSSGEGDTSHAFRGARLSDVLSLVAPTLVDDYYSINAIGVDDYLSEITMEEVRMENNVYVMYEDNGEPILTKDGSEQGMRLVILDDTFGMRFTKYLVIIELNAEPIKTE